MDSGIGSIFDSHLHIIDPRYPLIPNQGYLPEPFSCADYLARTRHLGVVGGAVVSGSFQGFEQSYLLAALECLGPAFVGVTQLPAGVSDAEIVRLDAAGVRALRFNLRRGGSEGLDQLERCAHRVHALVGWHVELYVEARHLPELYPRLAALPALSIDHLGLCAEGFEVLLRLVERGVRVKATGFGRATLDVPTALQRIASVNPGALLFGTDLPSTRAERPFDDQDVMRLVEALAPADPAPALVLNALAWYRPRRSECPAGGAARATGSDADADLG